MEGRKASKWPGAEDIWRGAGGMAGLPAVLQINWGPEGHGTEEGMKRKIILLIARILQAQEQMEDGWRFNDIEKRENSLSLARSTVN